VKHERRRTKRLRKGEAARVELKPKYTPEWFHEEESEGEVLNLKRENCKVRK
jgi:hypothetical protein